MATNEDPRMVNIGKEGATDQHDSPQTSSSPWMEPDLAQNHASHQTPGADQSTDSPDLAPDPNPYNISVQDRGSTISIDEPQATNDMHKDAQSTTIHSSTHSDVLFTQRMRSIQQAFDLSSAQQPAISNGQDVEPQISEKDWEDLEIRYRDEVHPRLMQEQQIVKSIHERFQQFMLWMDVSNDREMERSVKRLKTRVAYVQNSEATLKQKQEHYTKVVEAFQSAMALLASPTAR